MIINVGTKETGYKEIHDTRLLEEYLDSVSPRQVVTEDKKPFLSGRRFEKFLKISMIVLYGGLTLLGVSDIADAASTIINVAPLEKFFNEVYWTLFKVALYLSVPVWAWVGIIISTGGANQEKRTLAKKVGTGLVIGTGIIASAPWGSEQLYNVWRHVFA
jgi:hypothetical protein